MSTESTDDRAVSHVRDLQRRDLQRLDLRRHDLDALRGVAMLLGIVLHGAMSFFPFQGIWAVSDSVTSPVSWWLFSAIHGFRMPLFFLISGYFTMMLYRRRGMKSLLGQRFKRIVLPMLIGVMTIIPLNWTVSAYVAGKTQASQAVEETERPRDIFTAAAAGDLARLETLLEEGADVNQRSPDGATALLVAAFFGRVQATEWLLDRGADPSIANNKGDLPSTVLESPWGVTQWIAGAMKVEVDQTEVEQGRTQIAKLLPAMPSGVGDVKAAKSDGSEAMQFLLNFPVWGHLWFLWFLCWLVAGFSIVATFAKVLRFKPLPAWVTGRAACLWLIPLTVLAQSFMDSANASFGPNTSVGLLPLPAVLAYYAIFFGFGAVHYDGERNANDSDVELGDAKLGDLWWVAIPFSLIALFPLGLFVLQENVASTRLASLFVQASYAWLMTFGMMGLFRKFLSNQSAWMRYLSDSSYWLYLAHIPLIIYVQYWFRDYQWPMLIKFALVCSVTTLILLASYQLFIRYTPIGTLLNGKRSRKPATPEITTATLVEH